MSKKEEIERRIAELTEKANNLKKEADYYNALQLALKLILNGSYGALATKEFILFNNDVAGSITAEGRLLTKTVEEANRNYWKNIWATDKKTHSLMSITINNDIPDDESIRTSVYCDTDSLMISLEPALKNSTWKDLVIKKEVLESIKSKFVLIQGKDKDIDFNNSNCILNFKYTETDVYHRKDFVKYVIDTLSLDENKNLPIVCDGEWISIYGFFDFMKERKVKWNWSKELDFIHAFDKYRYCSYLKDILDSHAETYGIENKQDFELERISESQIHIARKRYISHILFEDGVPYDRLSYIYPKGIEIVRSSTPLFAREKIVDIIKYIFDNSETFNIKDLLKLVKDLRKEFDLCVPDKIDDISLQSSCSNYDIKVLNDKEYLSFVSGAHFAVKASAYYNYLLNKNKEYMDKYDRIKSKDKIKYYYCVSNVNPIFAYQRGSYPIEFAPNVDLPKQFESCILAPINNIIKPLGLPLINRRLSVVVDIFSGFKF